MNPNEGNLELAQKEKEPTERTNNESVLEQELFIYYLEAMH